MTTGIDLVVVNYRSDADLSAFCTSLSAFPPSRPWRLHIVSVCPLPSDLAVAKTAVRELDALHHIAQENIGYARACNYAARHGTYEYLAMFNADVRLLEGALEHCCVGFDEHPDWGVLGPRQVDDAGLMTHAGIFGTREQPKHRAWLVPDGPQYADVVEAVTVSGAAYFVRRMAWDELTYCPLYAEIAPAALGAFLPTPHYFEETWCSYHASDHGWKVIYYGEVSIVHRWHKASPVGGWAETQFPISQQIFRDACDRHGIPHD